MNRRTFSVEEKLRVLELAEALGSVSEACRREGFALSTFYAIKKAYDRYRRAGLEPRPRRKPRMPNTFAEEIIRKILELTSHFPSFSCERIAHLLRAEGVRASPSGVRKIRKRFGLTRKVDRIDKAVSIIMAAQRPHR